MKKTTWFYISVYNYGRKGVNRNFILNPEYTREEIANHMEQGHVDKELINLMFTKGIFLDKEITFVADVYGMNLYYNTWKKDGRFVTSERWFNQKDKVTFYPNGRYTYKYHWTVWDRIKEAAKYVMDGFFKRSTT